MRIQCTHPGRNGDILWSLPSVRAIAQAYGEQVHLVIPAQYGSLAPLLAQQAYIGSVLAREDWQVEQTAPITPRVPPQWETSQRADRVFHLGYIGWPRPTLPEDVYERCRLVGGGPGVGPQLGDPELPSLDLTTPWLTVDTTGCRALDYTVGFTDEHFELKYGLASLVQAALGCRTAREAVWLVPNGSRWDEEGGITHSDWLNAAKGIAMSKAFFGCCSALHVLAVGLGVPAVVMEPAPDRHNDVFFPCGKLGPQVTLVLGNDGRPTFDARHCGDALRKALDDVSRGHQGTPP